MLATWVKTLYCTFESFESVDRILRLPNWSKMETACTPWSCAKEGHQYQENYLLHFNSILINYKLVLEELDVLGEKYERPARSKWYRQFWELFCKSDQFCKRTTGWSDTEQWRLNVSWFTTDIHDFFCFSSFSLVLDCRITQAVMIAELLEGKLLKLLHIANVLSIHVLLLRSIF